MRVCRSLFFEAVWCSRSYQPLCVTRVRDMPHVAPLLVLRLYDRAKRTSICSRQLKCLYSSSWSSRKKIWVVSRSSFSYMFRMPVTSVDGIGFNAMSKVLQHVELFGFDVHCWYRNIGLWDKVGERSLEYERGGEWGRDLNKICAALADCLLSLWFVCCAPVVTVSLFPRSASLCDVEWCDPFSLMAPALVIQMQDVNVVGVQFFIFLQ